MTETAGLGTSDWGQCGGARAQYGGRFPMGQAPRTKRRSALADALSGPAARSVSARIRRRVFTGKSDAVLIFALLVMAGHSRTQRADKAGSIAVRRTRVNREKRPWR